MPQPHAFENDLALKWPPADWADVGVLVGVSGGPDSVALLRGLANLKVPGNGRIAVAHYNHRLRGADSEADERFVVDLAETLGLPCEVGRAREVAAAEEVARELRYAFLAGTAENLGARFVATAHTADDQAETILHHIVRGTGLAGLSGMSRVRPLGPNVSLIRPLLTLRRAALIDYLKEIGQDFREDASNLDPRYTRNRIRHELLPHLASDYNAHVVAALLRLGSLAGEARRVIDELVRERFNAAVHPIAGGVVIDAGTLADAPPYVVRELFMQVWRQQGWPLQEMGFAEWEKLAAMSFGAESSRPQTSLPGGVVARLQDGKLFFLG